MRIVHLRVNGVSPGKGAVRRPSGALMSMSAMAHSPFCTLGFKHSTILPRRMQCARVRTTKS